MSIINPSQISSIGTGNVVGPATSVDNTVVRFDGITGKLIQGSVVSIADNALLEGALLSLGSVRFANALDITKVLSFASTFIPTGVTLDVAFSASGSPGVATLSFPDAPSGSTVNILSDVGFSVVYNKIFDGPTTFITSNINANDAELAFDILDHASHAVTTFDINSTASRIITFPDQTTTLIGTATTDWIDLTDGGDTTLHTHSIYLTSLSGAVLVSQATPQTIGDTTNRLLKLWATDITCTNNITGSITGNAATVTTNANLTGPVTSVGNATAIADKALAIAKLADGTAGQLITWSAAGVIATVATGTATQVLTSNGAGAAPTFQAAAGGGMSIGGAVTSGTTGSILFVGAGPVLAQDNATLFWDNTNKRLGIGTTTPGADLEIKGVAGTGTVAPDFLLTAGAHTALTASTEHIDMNINLARTVQFNTGALTTQRAMYIQSPTYTMTSLDTLTTAATLAISGPAAASGTINLTNTYGLLIETRALNTNLVENGIGLVVHAPTGAFGANGAASFMGRTGIGTLAPVTDFEVLAAISVSPASPTPTFKDGTARGVSIYYGATAVTLPTNETYMSASDLMLSPVAASGFTGAAHFSGLTLTGASNFTGGLSANRATITVDESSSAGTITGGSVFRGAFVTKTSSGTAGAITTARACILLNNFSGLQTVGTYVGLDQTFTFGNIAGTTTDTIGMRIGNPSKGASYTLTNFTAIDLISNTATIGTLNIGIRQRGTTQHNRFNGDTSIGQDATPGATLDVSGKLFVAGATGTISKYNNITTVEAGVPSSLASSKLTAQAAAIGATTIYAVPAAGAGFYRISWVASVTTAATTSSILGGAGGFQVVYTDLNDNVVKTSNPTTITAETSAGNTTATTVSGVRIAYCKASTNLQYSFGYTSVGVTGMAFDLSIVVERL